MTEDYAELIEGLSVTFDSMQTNKTNEIMKTLTLISSIVLPLTFVTSLYGMNVLLPLQENPFAFWVLMGIMFVAAILLVFFFHKKRWM
jgi:magnesium transporter